MEREQRLRYEIEEKYNKLENDLKSEKEELSKKKKELQKEVDFLTNE